MKMQELKAGTRVYIITHKTPHEVHLKGVIGVLWGTDPLEIMCRFDDGRQVYVKPEYLHLFHLEPLS